MVRPTRLVRSGLLTVAGALLVTGCGGGEDTGSAAASSSSPGAAATPSSSAPASVAPDAEAFCAEAGPVFSDLDTAFEAVETQGVPALPPLLDQAVAAFDEVTPPAELATDWQTVRDGFAQLRDRVGALDPDSPDAAAQVAGAVAAVEGSEAGPALGRLDSYYQQNCASVASPTG